MKGIILAGGSGSRLYPLTIVTSKQLLPVYNKPMIYYPLSILMMAGIKDILIISTPLDLPRFKSLFKDGKDFGIKLSYIEQAEPEGLAQAFTLGEKIIGDDACAMILGDNIFYGEGLEKHLKNSVKRATKEGKATIYGFSVKDPERFGVVEFDKNKVPTRIVEKDPHPKSNYAVTGLYFYPKGVSSAAKTIKKSARGEYEITDLNNFYLENKNLHITFLKKGYRWLDAGTHESLMKTSNFVQRLESRKGITVCCPEEIAFNNGWISKKTLIEDGNKYKGNEYGKHLLDVANKK